MLNVYEKGATAYVASRYDQRFGYYLYVPEAFSFDCAADYQLIVVIHGSNRTPQTYRDLFKDFATAHKCIVLTPLFPAGIYEDGTEANYKFLRSGGLNFDTILLEMVKEVRGRYMLPDVPFYMHGFSGGGHFAHRFFYFHPQALKAVSIGAPGMVTLLDASQNWHCGVKDFEGRFGQALDYESMRGVAVHMVVGADDTETWEITIEEDDPLWMPGVNDAGRTRLERLAALRHSYEAQGVSVQYSLVTGVGHDGFKLLEPVKAFFASILKQSQSHNRQ
ncbi:alpha/beta hydrolase [Kordiimonas pumila]|uniref:Alpha/beta hydrolase n=1 Tax=Kordiimonas pumila TaxID=2161677 RepID=A0ABV7D553_9PROT|nr:alpha/beta hydrolase [Kordiimonas pumila]